jgi:hypothetical protein
LRIGRRIFRRPLLFSEKEFAMADTSSKDALRKRAQSHFTATEQRDSLVKQMIASERAAVDAKSARLRTLRLAKEAADREAALNAPLPQAANKPKVRGLSNQQTIYQ